MFRSLSKSIVTSLIVGFALLGLLTSGQVQAQETMTFKVQVTTYAYGKLWYPPAAAMTVQSDGGAVTYAADEAGLLNFNVPIGVTSTWNLSLGNWEVDFRAEFQDGTMLLYDVTNNNISQAYYLQPDGSYAIEYYHDAIYVTNQSQLNAPIVGWLTENAKVGAKTMSTMENVARWWSYVDSEHPEYTFWMEWTYTGRGNFEGLLKMYGPAEQLNYHFKGLASEQSDSISFDAYHQTSTGVVDYQVAGTITSPITATGTITLPDVGTLNVTGTGWQVDPTGDGGGAENHFGGGGPYSRLLGNQQVSAEINTAKTNGTSYQLNRTLPYSSNYSNVAAVVVEWVRPGGSDGAEQLALDSSGTMSNGITWQTGLAYNYSVNLVDFRRTLPASFISGLESGVHTIKYWLVDADGRLSNIRTETIEII